MEDTSGYRIAKAKKTCKNCEYKALLNKESLCGSCEELKMRDKRNICSMYKNEVKKGEEGVMCDRCNVWHHVDCERIKEDTYRILRKDRSILWFCTACNPEARKEVKEAERFREENIELRKELDIMKGNYGGMENEVAKLKEWSRQDSMDDKEKEVFLAQLTKLQEENENVRERFEMLEEAMKKSEERVMRRIKESEEETIKRIEKSGEETIRKLDER